jgi:UDP-N-acetyl-2-amino-2-deoxyglucuronate dehydrogenase
MTKLRVGLIGLGAVAEVHLQAYAGVREIEVVAGSDPATSTRKHVAQRHGLRYFETASDMLRAEEIDLACVLAPPRVHEELVTLCAERGVHVLCEKPLALDSEAAQRMVETCARANVKLFYGASYRFLPAILAARKMIQTGAIGDVRLLRESIIGGEGEGRRQALGFLHYPEGSPGGSGLGLVDHGIHLIDVLEWLSGSRAVAVFGQGNISGAPAHSEYLIMHLASGAVAHLLYNDATFATDLPNEGTFSAGLSYDFSGPVVAGGWSKYPACIHIHGSAGALRIFYYANALFHTSQAGIRQIRVPEEASPQHFAAQIRACARSIADDSEPDVDGAAGVRALRILHGAYRSAETGTLISI